jgi:excisionase family DNA binding protein
MKTITILPGERLLDTKAVAKTLKVSTDKVLELVEEGTIEAIDLGTECRHLYRFHPAFLLRVMQRRSTIGCPPN